MHRKFLCTIPSVVLTDEDDIVGVMSSNLSQSFFHLIIYAAFLSIICGCDSLQNSDISSGEFTIDIGNHHTIVSKIDGPVWTWGANRFGQLGDGTIVEKTTPFQIDDLGNVIKVAAGAAHSLALVEDGTVFTWGDNVDGQLGTVSGEFCNVAQTSTCAKTPIKIEDFEQVKAIFAAQLFSAAIKLDGTVWAWGAGLLGNGVTTASTTPVQVCSPDALDIPCTLFVTDINIIDIGGSGSGFMLALQNSGTVLAWGNGSYGELGVRDVKTRSIPSRVCAIDATGPCTEYLTNVIQISAGGNHSLALLQDGRLLAWGKNNYGQLGVESSEICNDLNCSTVPLVVPITGVTMISAGDNHSMVLKDDGSVWVWGLNSDGQAGGISESTCNSLPCWKTPSKIDIKDITFVDAGSNHNIAIKSNGSVWAWGENTSGELGNNSKTSSATPVSVCNSNSCNDSLQL